MIVKLYNKDLKNNIREWAIEWEEGRLRTSFGILGGKIQTTEWTQVGETNVGRANHRNLLEQAEFQADAQIKKQLEGGWKKSLEELETKEKVFGCMLAENFEDRKKNITFPVRVQPKLDGIRLNVDANSLLSRNRKEFKSVPHLEFLKDFCKTHNCVLDGELYNHNLKHDFNKITSLVKKTKPTEQDLKESSEVIQYWIYDVFFFDAPELTYEQRLSKYNILLFLIQKENPCIVLVPSLQALHFEGIDEIYGRYLEDGYEGIMVRMDAPYEQKRGKSLLKRKEFFDAEYEIVEIREGNGNRAGTAGYAIMKNKDGSTFRSNIKGNREWVKQLLADAESVVGKMATIQYLNLTPDGVPRFPFLITIRDYE